MRRPLGAGAGLLGGKGHLRAFSYSNSNGQVAVYFGALLAKSPRFGHQPPTKELTKVSSDGPCAPAPCPAHAAVPRRARERAPDTRFTRVARGDPCQRAARRAPS